MTTAFVATIGGHISELVALADRIAGDGDRVWITNENAQTRDLLAGRNVEFVPFIDERDVAGVLRSTKDAKALLRKHSVSRVVSTGSAIALGYLPMAAVLGIDAHYIECSARVTAPSVTGKLLRYVPGVKTWWQYEQTPAGFRHLGGIFDPFQSSDRESKSSIQKVVVTVGTTSHDFRRLIEPLARVIPADAEVLWQTGKSNTAGLDIDGREMVPEDELISAIDRADVVVAHAGCGSLLMALNAGKVPVYVPRRFKHGEQVDDHQAELATWALDHGLAVTVEADEIELTHLLEAASKQVARLATGKVDLR